MEGVIGPTLNYTIRFRTFGIFHSLEDKIYWGDLTVSGDRTNTEYCSQID